MAQSTLNLEVTNDHAVPIEPMGGTATVLNVSGDTLFYADSPQVSAASNQGSLTAGQSAAFTTQAWMLSTALSTVQVIVVGAQQTTGGGSGVTLGFDGGLGIPPGPPLSEIAQPPFLAGLDVEKIVSPPHAAAALAIPAYDGSGQSVEPTVLYFPSGWGSDSNGKAWRYWMSSSPFTNGNAAFENPSLYVSDDGINWSVPPGLTNPVIGAPASGNNDDPFLYMGPDGLMYLFWNWEGNSVTPSKNGVYYVTSTDGVHWSASAGSAANKLIDSSPTQSTLTMLAPRFAYFRGVWHVWWLDATGGTPFVMYHVTASALTYAAMNTAAQSPTLCTGLSAGNGDTELWEPEIRRVAGEWWMLFCTRPTNGGGAGGNLWFCTSPDGVNWTQSSKPMLSGTGTTGDWDWKVYKGSFVPVFDGRGLTLKIWYSGEGTDSKWKTGYTVASSNPSNVNNSQLFTATAGGKWRKPAGATNVMMLAIGAGGGGGSGNLAAAAANAFGGAGGGAGGVSVAYYRAADLPDGVYTVGVGVGGTGAAATTTPGNGANGGAGGGSFVQGPSGSLTYVRALGGAGGTNGFTTGAGTGGAGGTGVTPGGAGANGANGAGATSAAAVYATGGGGGGGVTTAAVAAAGGAGQSPINSNATAGAAGAIGANGGNGTAAPGQLGGSGGGGGGGAVSGVAGSGGAAGGFGAGGGGGGGAQGPATSSGAGIVGGQGAVLIMAW